MNRSKTIVYVLACVVLGVAWDVVLSWDPKDQWSFPPLSSGSGWLVLLALVLSSVTVGLSFRRPISRWSAPPAMCLGCVLAFVGAIIDLWIYMGFRQIAGSNGTHLTLRDTLEFYAVAVPFLAAYLVASRAVVTLPMGIASVFVLRKIERWTLPRDQAARGGSR
jgi:hypothetical protein